MLYVLLMKALIKTQLPILFFMILYRIKLKLLFERSLTFDKYIVQDRNNTYASSYGVLLQILIFNQSLDATKQVELP